MMKYLIVLKWQVPRFCQRQNSSVFVLGKNFFWAQSWRLIAVSQPTLSFVTSSVKYFLSLTVPFSGFHFILCNSCPFLAHQLSLPYAKYWNCAHSEFFPRRGSSCDTMDHHLNALPLLPLPRPPLQWCISKGLVIIFVYKYGMQNTDCKRLTVGIMQNGSATVF